MTSSTQAFVALVWRNNLGKYIPTPAIETIAKTKIATLILLFLNANAVPSNDKYNLYTVGF